MLSRSFLVLVFVIGIVACSAPKNAPDETPTTVVSPAETVPVEVDSGSVADVTIYASMESDSLLIQNGRFRDEVMNFMTKGNKFYDKAGTAIGCPSNVRKFKLGSSTMIVIKGDCGESGFENHQFVMRGDSLKVYRKYKAEFTGGNTSLSEEINEFRGPNVINSRRYKNTIGWKDLTLWNTELMESVRGGESSYTKFVGWMKGAE